MESHELLREVFDTKSAKEVSADLDLSTSMVYKWTQPPRESGAGRVDNPLARIEALYQSTGDHRLIQWICQRAGGTSNSGAISIARFHMSPLSHSCGRSAVLAGVEWSINGRYHVILAPKFAFWGFGHA